MKNFDISKHSYVPKHVKISEEEKKKVLEKFNISEQQLPKIFESDPAIKSLNPKIGDVIKITRKSPTNKDSIFYRVVING